MLLLKIHVYIWRTVNRLYSSSAIIIIRDEWRKYAESRTTDRKLLGWEFRERAKLGLASSLRLRGATVVFYLFQFPDTSEPWRTCYFAAAVAAAAAAQFSIVPSTVQRNVSKRLERSSREVCSKGYCSTRETSVRVILLNLIWPHNGTAITLSLSLSLTSLLPLSLFLYPSFKLLLLSQRLINF